MLQDSHAGALENPPEGAKPPKDTGIPINGSHAPRRAQGHTIQAEVKLHVTISWRDPEGKGRSIGQQLDDAVLKIVSAVGLSDETGRTVACLPTQEIALPIVDQVEFRTPGERLDALHKKAEEQAVAALEAQNAS